jgi:perosamine synthetase
MNPPVSRRRFLRTTATAGAASAAVPAVLRAADSGPAKLGGPPAHPGPFPGWPVYDATEEKALHETLHSGQWFRGSGRGVSRFETAYARLTGARHCVATSCGTSALAAALGALDLGPGDEVLLPPYTFIATYNVVTLNYALPVFVDVDPESFQIDAGRIPEAITPETRAIVPVHIGGSPADLDAILAAAQPRKIPVIEDACQAHLAEWRGRSVGTWGLAGCFSFQASKNLNSGEGGAVLTNDDAFATTCLAFHSQGRAKPVADGAFTHAGTRGANLRLSEFQGNLLQAQMTRVVEQTRRRTGNAEYLTRLLGEIPGIRPAKLYPGTTRSAYHLYMFRYDAGAFAGLDRAKFLAALGAEGVPCSGGYGPMHREPYVHRLARDPHYLRVYGEARMKRWLERHECPANDRLCAEAVWFTQNMLLGPRTDMDQIAEAIRKIQRHASDLAKA